MDADTYLCGHICMAARHLGFKLVEVFDAGTVHYGWVDLMNNRSVWLCDGAATKKEALILACNAMQQYLTTP